MFNTVNKDYFMLFARFTPKVVFIRFAPIVDRDGGSPLLVIVG